MRPIPSCPRAAGLRALGLAPGDVVLVHSSARSLGFVAGEPQAIVAALLDVLGPDGTSQWISWTDVTEDSGDFERIGADFEEPAGLSAGAVGNATARLMSQRAIVDFATAWITAHRPAS